MFIKSHRMTPALECLFYWRYTLWNHKHKSMKIMHVLHNSQRATRLKGQNKMCICGKKLLYFIWLWIYSKGIKPDLNYSVKSYNFSMRCGLFSLANLFLACKERYNLCMNHASLDCESLDRVSWTSTTLTDCQTRFFVSHFKYWIGAGGYLGCQNYMCKMFIYFT